MFVTKLRAGAVVLVATCVIASLTTLSAAPPQDPAAEFGGDGGVPSKGSLFTPDKTLMFVNVHSSDPGHNQNFLYVYVSVNSRPEIKRVQGVGASAILGNRGYAMRIRLNSDLMRAHNVSPEDIKRAFEGCRTAWPALLAIETAQSTEYELTRIGNSNKPEQYGNIILKAGPGGEIVRLKDVSQVELDSSFFNISSDIDGHSTAIVALKRTPGSNATEVIEAVKEKLKHIKEESFPSGMEFEVVPFDNRDMIYAVIEAPPGSPLEYTTAKCHELGVIAKGVNEVTSVTSLAGYQVRTESGASNVGTCLIQLKDGSDSRLTSRQIIETLKEKCRAMNVCLEFFEPPAVLAFFADGGFSVRVLDKTNSMDHERSGTLSERSLDDLLNSEDLAGLFNFLASNYPQYELVIDNDVALQQGASIVNALENLAKAVAGDVQPELKFRALVEELSHGSVKNERGETAPYRMFLQLKNSLWLSDTDPLLPETPRRNSS